MGLKTPKGTIAMDKKPNREELPENEQPVSQLSKRAIEILGEAPEASVLYRLNWCTFALTEE